MNRVGQPRKHCTSCRPPGTTHPRHRPTKRTVVGKDPHEFFGTLSLGDFARLRGYDPKTRTYA